MPITVAYTLHQSRGCGQHVSHIDMRDIWRYGRPSVVTVRDGMIDHDRLYAIIGERMRSIREAQTPRMSQEDLGLVLSLKRTSITNIESGQQRLTLEAIYRLCERFGLEVSDVLPAVSDVTRAEAQPVVVGGHAQEIGVKTARVLEQLRPAGKARR